MDNQHLKKLSYLGAVGTVENLVKRLRHRQKQNDLLAYINSLGEMFPPRLSPSPSVYYFVCFAPFTEEDGGRAVDSHDRWQSVCVCMLLCLFSTPLFLRGVSARHNQYSGIVLPPHLIQWDPKVWGVRCLIGQRRQVSFSCIRRTRPVSVKYLKNASSYRHISIVYGVYVYVS